MAVTQVTDGELSDTLYAQFQRLGSWAAVGRHYGVSRTIVWRICKDNYMPKDAETRRRLGLPEIVHQIILRDKRGRFRRRGR